MKTLGWLCAGVGLGVLAYWILNEPGLQHSTGSKDVEDAAHAAANWGSKQQVQGAGSDLLGRVKEGVGNLTGSDQLANEGVGDQIAGAAKQAVGKFSQAAGQTLHDLNR